MATTERKFGFTTRQLHSGYDPDAVTGSRAAPIYLATAYDLQSCELNPSTLSILAWCLQVPS
jgi:O-acetylhomoserine (thiol)-lyase